jgi:putative inorganic carbon (HCO3(-)) transporter
MGQKSKVLRTLILVGVVLIPLVFYTGLNDVFDLPKMALAYLLVIWFWTIWIINRLRNGTIKFRTTPLDVPILIFLALLGVATIFSVDRNLSLWGKYIGYYFGFIPILTFAGLYWASVQVMDEELGKRMTMLLIVTGFSVATYGILQYYGVEPVNNMPDFSGRPPVSSLGNPLYFACYILMVFFLALMNILYTKKRTLGYYFQIVLIFVSIVSIVLSLSRSAWVAFFAGALFYIMKVGKQGQVRKLKRAVIPAFVFITFILVLWSPGREKFISIFSKRDSSNIARLEGWKAGLKTFLERPVIGTGPSTFRYGFEKHKSIEYMKATGTGVVQADAHNDIIQFLATTGLTGFFAYLYLWYVLFTRGIKKIGKDDNPIETGCFLSLLALFVQNQFNFSTVTTSVTAAFLAGILFYERKERVVSINIPRFLRNVGAPVLIILAGLVTFRVARLVQADLMYKKGMLSGDGNIAIPLVSQVTQIAPLNEVYLNGLVECYREVAIATEDKELKHRYIDEAIELAKRNVDYHPYDSWLYHNYASVIAWAAQETIGRGNPRALYEEYCKAWAMYRKSIELHPNFVQSWVNLGKLAHLMGDIEKAKGICRKVLEMDPKNEGAQVVLENLRIACGENKGSFARNPEVQSPIVKENLKRK